MAETETLIKGESTLVFFVNGKKVIDNDVDPEWTLLYYLRTKLRLCGTKLGCAEGGCGACTIMVSRYNRKKKKIIHLAVNACLAPICSVHGCAVTTVEGIGSTRTKLHPIQERLAKAHGSQCGFCTPGIIMSMYALLREKTKPTMLDMEIAFQGNLCRCTGYRPIIEGLRTFTEEWEKDQVEKVMNLKEKNEMLSEISKGIDGDKNTYENDPKIVNGTNGSNYTTGENEINGNDHTLRVNGTSGKNHLKEVNGINGKYFRNSDNEMNESNHTNEDNGINVKDYANINRNYENNSHKGENGLSGTQYTNYNRINGSNNTTTANGINGKDCESINGMNGNENINRIKDDRNTNKNESRTLNRTIKEINKNQHNKLNESIQNGNANDGSKQSLNENAYKLIKSNKKISKTSNDNFNDETIEQPRIKTCGMGKNCCKFNFDSKYKDPEEILFSYNEFTPYDPSQEAIFPPELMVDATLDEQTLVIKGPRATWYRPTSFKDVLLLKNKFPNAKIINGNTEVGVEVKFKNFVYPVLINPIFVKEMTEIAYLENGIKFGAAVTLNEINETLKREVATKPESKTRIFRAAIHIFHWFAGKQIRNVSAIGGNLMTGSPISDMNPVLMAADVDLYLTSLDSSRIIKMDHTFFTGYRRNVVKPDEVLTAILFPYSHENQYFNAYKQAKRRDDDIAIVNCAANVEFHPGTHIIKNILIAYGGVAPCTTLAMKTREKLVGREWNDEMVEDAFDFLLEELTLPPNAPGGNVSYRRSLVPSLFYKFYLFVRNELSRKCKAVDSLPERFLSGISGFHSKDLKSSQYFQVVPKNKDKIDAVGQPLVHVNAFKQTTGEAIYCDDIPKIENELYATLVTSTKPHAKILSIDTSQALALPGVHGFFSAKDVDEDCHDIGPILHDEKVFYTDRVTSQGQVIGAIVADNQIISQRASKLVKIEYEDLSPVVITVEQAIEHNSYIGAPKKIISGNPEEAFKQCDFIREGEVHIGGQEHFYLETQCALAVPREDEIEIFSSSQNAAEIQKLAAHVLNIPCNRVVTRVKRIGGGFGGKESRANVVALPIALIAYKIKRPVRCMLDRDEDMIISGTRHPFLTKYKVGFNKDGKILAVQMHLYCNAGYSMDLSCGVLDRALFHAENAYRIPNVEVHGYLCRTNLPSNTAFRGFGGPQGMFVMESIIDEVALTVNKPQEEIRYMHLYEEGDKTHYNQVIENCTIKRCWEECYKNSDFEKRKEEIEEFNRNNRFKKRGISIVPTKFGIAFTEVSLNQAGALVHVYRDGSVLLTHGGVEIGQGLHTKMIQVASKALDIDASLIFISETATDKVPNTSATAASAGSDLNGMAVMNACQKIVERLEPFKKANPKGTWKEWIQKAYYNRVGLSATGFYMTPGLGYNFNTNSGNAFNYFTYGVAVSSVEIDCLTGDHQVLRTDIVMDLGESLNPAIDIGQVEGAFIQGQGLFTLEELIYSPTGTSYTRGPGMYKIPGFADIPLEFNVSLLRGASNPRAVYSSKAVGEPPLFLASSIFFAIKSAIVAAREEEGIKGNFRFDSPATSSKIRTCCIDKIIKKLPKDDPKTYQPWNIVP